MAETITNQFSFMRGWSQLQQKDVQVAKAELMAAIGITSHPNWLRRLRGEVEPKVTEHAAITAVFKKYGITKVWGN